MVQKLLGMFSRLRFRSYVSALSLSVGLLTTVVSSYTYATGILVYGDSISAGYGLPDKSGWVTLLEQRLQQEKLPFNVVNLSISGETTSGGLTRLPKALRTHFPQILVIELGGNDGLRGTSLKAIEQNLEQMVQLAKAKDVVVVLLGMRIPPNYGRPYTEGFFNVFAKVAERHNLPYMPFFLEGVGDNPALMQNDGIHPNEQAQVKLLNNLWPILLSQLQSF